jgi:hypothetical protein
MGTPGRLAVGIALGLAALAAAQETPYGRATTLPTTELHGGLPDFTPPELLKPPPPGVCDSGPPTGGFYAAVEFLYLTPRERGLDFAIVDPRNDLVPAGTVQSLNYKPNAGVRGSIAYALPGRGWDLGFTYTYFSARDEFGIAAPDGGLLYPTLTRPGLTNEAAVASAHAHLTLNIYDLTAGRTWQPDEFSRWRFFGGVRLATVRQTFDAGYDGRDADGAFVDTKQSWTGTGPLFGAETWCQIGGGFGLFGRATGALLTGTMTNPLTETNNGGATVYTDLRDRFALTVPMLSLAVGVSYEYRGLFIRAGYEVTHFFSLFERPAFVDSFAEGKFVRQSSNLALDGLFVQMGLTF